MEKVVLGKTNVSVPIVSLGTWSYGGENVSGDMSVGWFGQTDERSRQAMIRSWELGISHWDTADVYGEGRSEAVIGSMWNTIPRDDIFLATKFGWSLGPYSHLYHPKHMRNQFERSLKLLKTNTVDLLYLHHCNFGDNEEYFDDANEILHRMQEEGKTRYLGLSDWDLNKMMRFIDRVNPDVVQPYRNVMDDTFDSSGLRKYVENHNIGVCFFSPIKHGLLTGKYTKATSFPKGDYRRNVPDFENQDIIDKMRYNRSLLLDKFSDHPQPVMRGLIDSLLPDSPTGCVLLGMRDVEQVEAASKLGNPLSVAESDWVKNLYFSTS